LDSELDRRIQAMQIVITGGAGFLGQRLARALLNRSLVFDELLLVDIVLPHRPGKDHRITCLKLDLSREGAAKSIVSPETGIIFHLAAFVSSHAEKDFDLGWKVNLDITRQLLEACRHQKSDIRFVFASSLAVYGEPAICPVSLELALWLSSPDTAIQNIIHASTLDGADFGDWRTVNLPGIGVTVQHMLDSLERITDKATLARIQFKPDQAINTIVSSWPGVIDNSRALQLRFQADTRFDDFITQYITHHKQQA